ncbi:hypothetical protein SASPL_116169 [Salvia splendens]|uniref:RSE1/DDB1/CPSF1 second beta-propeller domain-containing protein n=1 Tax=Salvia splendens TaxID=180675 RepID=A0A8X8Y4J0_SALSN|nr:hypothetical protein SASPL_116169 [Salvia splendens]
MLQSTFELIGLAASNSHVIFCLFNLIIAVVVISSSKSNEQTRKFIVDETKTKMVKVIQVFSRGARILDGAFMTQDLNLKSSNTETNAASDGATVSSVSIADPYVLLRMIDGSIQLLVGGMSGQSL